MKSTSVRNGELANVGTFALLTALAVPDEQRAQVMGLSNTGLTTMMGVSPLIGGVLADQLTPHGTVGIFGVAGLVLTLPLAALWTRTLSGEPEKWIDKEAARAEHA